MHKQTSQPSPRVVLRYRLGGHVGVSSRLDTKVPHTDKSRQLYLRQLELLNKLLVMGAPLATSFIPAKCWSVRWLRKSQTAANAWQQRRIQRCRGAVHGGA